MGNIQYIEAQQLRKNWGNKPCEHKDWLKEYYNGTSTGDYICSQCGKAVYETKLEDIKNKG